MRVKRDLTQVELVLTQAMQQPDTCALANEPAYVIIIAGVDSNDFLLLTWLFSARNTLHELGCSR